MPYRSRGKQSMIVSPKNKQDTTPTCFCCKNGEHVKKECIEYYSFRAKKGNLIAIVFSKVNLASLNLNTSQVDFGVTFHVTVKSVLSS